MLRRNFFYLCVMLTAACGVNKTTITVTSTPNGAQVSEASKGALGKTPVTLDYSLKNCKQDINQCRVSFYFSMPGYQDQRIERLVEAEENGMTVHAYLMENKTRLEVSGFPSFATLDVKYQAKNGKWKKLSLIEDEGFIPSLEDEEPWGGKNYCLVRIIAESPGYVRQQQVITIKKGEHKTIEYALNEYAIVGEILSQPAGADVFEKSLGYLGRTPFKIRISYDQLMRISAQRKQNLDDPIYLYLKFTKEGFKPKEQISSIGEINESEDPVHFSIPASLQISTDNSMR